MILRGGNQDEVRGEGIDEQKARFRIANRYSHVVKDCFHEFSLAGIRVRNGCRRTLRKGAFFEWRTRTSSR